MPERFSTTRQVEFRDTDAAGIMHFASIIALMEEAEHEFLRAIGLPLFRPHGAGQVSWPRVSVKCDFKSPARFEDKLEIAVDVERIGRKSVTYHFTLTCEQRSIAEGWMTAACCFVESGQIKAIEIPADTRQGLEKYQIPESS